MKLTAALAAGVLFAASAPTIAYAQGGEENAQAPEAAPETEQAEDDDSLDMNRRICKTQKVTGSRLAKRKVCRTAYEWKKYEEDTQELIGQALNRRSAVGDNN